MEIEDFDDKLDGESDEKGDDGQNWAKCKLLKYNLL